VIASARRLPGPVLDCLLPFSVRKPVSRQRFLSLPNADGARAVRVARFLAKCETAVMLSLSSTDTRGVKSSPGSRPWEQTGILRRRPSPLFSYGQDNERFRVYSSSHSQARQIESG